MEQTASRIDGVLADLRKDLESARKARLTTVIVGSVLVLIWFIGFWNLNRLVRKNVREDTLADVAAYATREAIKAGRPALEQTFKTNMQAFLKNLRVAFVNDVIPAMRKQAEGQLKGMVEKSFKQSSQAFMAATRETIAGVKAQAPGQTATDPAFLASRIIQEFEKQKQKKYSETPEQTLGAEFLDSKRMLDGLNTKLNLLLSGKPKSREEAMELRFLRAWVSLIGKGDSKTPPGPPLAPTASPAP